MHIDEIRTGGQSGADRAAFDVARLYNIPICGWCPKGGWAEDMPEPPGLLAVYPEMIETPSDGTIQRTEWNIRDSSVCIVFDTFENTTSPGTDAGMTFFDKYDVPCFEYDLNGGERRQFDELFSWLEEISDRYDPFVLGVGGPRASVYDGIYVIVFDILDVIISKIQ